MNLLNDLKIPKEELLKVQIAIDPFLKEYDVRKFYEYVKEHRDDDVLLAMLTQVYPEGLACILLKNTDKYKKQTTIH